MRFEDDLKTINPKIYTKLKDFLTQNLADIAAGDLVRTDDGKMREIIIYDYLT